MNESRFAGAQWMAIGVAVLTLVIGLAIGWREAAVIGLGTGFIAGTAWWSAAMVRVGGSLMLAGVVWIFAAPNLGPGAAALVVTGVAALTWKFLPTRVQRRVCFMLPSLVMLIFVTSMLMYMAPGNPFAQEKVASPQVEEALRKLYGVPRDPTEFFIIYMKRLVLEGSLGPAIKVQGRTVQDLLMPALPVSISLGLLALILACGIGLVLGIRAGLKPNSAADYSSMALAMVGISLPNFVIGAGLMIVFSLSLGWLPVAGWGGYPHLILPALTLALPYAAYIARLARGGTIEVMQQDFVRTARAKGLSESTIIVKHALKGAILPVVSFLGPAAAGILTGSFVVETLFGIPGMGQWFVKGAINRDYSVVLGTAIIYCTLVTAFNLFVDLAYAWLDPRIREER